MALIHSIAAFDQHGLRGLQSLQRDWSPYVVHFTSYAAMSSLRNWRHTDRKPATIASKLETADQSSFRVVTKIASSGTLRASSPSQKDGIADCVCFSECNLPGLIGHSERYGRFGFVFDKAVLFKADARPCCYMAPDEYTVVSKLGKRMPTSTPEGRLYSLANVYRPPGNNGPVQDFSHEREWRAFTDIDFSVVEPAFMIAPKHYLKRMQSLFPGIAVIPLDTLFVWGA